MDALALTLLALSALLIVRNHLVYRAVSRRTEEIHEHNFQAIEAGKYDALLSYSAVGHYDSMLFDITKWTYRQFYPEQFH
jgi:hypothetical protein